jgi:translocation and assembly module TamB
LPQGYDYAGSISAVFRGRGSPNAAWQGTASIDVDDVTVTTQGQNVALLKNGSGNAELTIDDSVFALDVLLDSQQGELEAHARAGRSGPDAALAGEMRGFLSSLELLTLPFPELLDVTGELAFNVELQGSVGTPVYSGGISLLDGAASLVATGITLENISLELTGSADEIIIGGEAHSGEGAVRLDGALGWPEGTPSGRFSFGGQQFRFIDLPGIRVDASPDLEFVVAGRELELTGNVHVDSVDVAPIDLRQAVRVSPDEIVIGETAPERWRISSRVSVSLGEDVLPGRPATGSGELAIEDGLFSAYGQSLDIERGRLLFSGGPLDNPTLDVRAVRQFETITVGVDVRGPLQDPQITVFSDPPRPRQYALATLIMGAAPVELGRASDTLAYGRSSGPGDRTIGLGDLSAGGASSPNSFLAPDFYLGYLESISLRYRLSRRWTIGVGRGAETSLDVAYSVR